MRLFRLDNIAINVCLRMTHIAQRLLGLIKLFVLACLLSGCASHGLIQNQPVAQIQPSGGYSLATFKQRFSKNDHSLMLAFSGGGTRAAAFSYGVLGQLRDTLILKNAQPQRLLDDVGIISSVSGGSFTAAYYGLHGDGIFKDFEQDFLRKNVEKSLITNLLNPLHWFTPINRTEYAIQYYEKEVFKGATFADMLRPGAPMILINATDLTRGVRFSFMQEYFNLLCSDLASFPVSRAVAASSAIPLLFKPVVIENHSGCSKGISPWLAAARIRANKDSELALTVTGMESYYDKANHRYAHLVDGGISDNLGLRSIFDVTRLVGGTEQMLEYLKLDSVSRFVIISVDASTQPHTEMGASKNAPSIANTINAMTDIQLHRYNTATVAQMKRSMKQWGHELSNSSKPVDAYFIRLSFDKIKDQDVRNFINQIPTSFALTDRQVDSVIKAGRDLLVENPEFQRLLRDIARED